MDLEEGTWIDRAFSRFERDITHRRGRWNDVVKAVVKYLNGFEFPFKVTPEVVEDDVIEFLQDTVESLIDEDEFIDNSAIEDK